MGAFSSCGAWTCASARDAWDLDEVGSKCARSFCECGQQIDRTECFKVVTKLVPMAFGFGRAGDYKSNNKNNRRKKSLAWRLRRIYE